MRLRKKKSKILSFIKATVSLIVICVIFVFIIRIPKIVIVKNIYCTSQFGPCSQTIIEKIDEIKGNNLSNVKIYLNEILEDDAQIRKYSYQLKLPNSLYVNVVERKPQYALVNDQEGKALLIDKTGKVLAVQESSTLPSVHVNKDLPLVSEYVDDEMLLALDIIYDMHILYQVTSGFIEDEGLHVELDSAQRVIFPLEGEREVLIGGLRTIISRLNSESEDSRIEGEKICAQGCTIDMRFDNPVIKNK